MSLDHIRNIIIRFGRRISHVGGNLHIGRSHHEDIPRRLFDIAAQGIYRAADKIENPLRHGNIDLIQVDDNRLAGFQIIDEDVGRKIIIFIWLLSPRVSGMEITLERRREKLGSS